MLLLLITLLMSSCDKQQNFKNNTVKLDDIGKQLLQVPRIREIGKVKALLEKDTDVNVVDKSKYTPVYEADLARHVNIVVILKKEVKD